MKLQKVIGDYMKKIIKCPPSRITRFIDGFGNKRIYIRGIGSFLENEVIIDTSMYQKKLNEFAIWGV
ncbi:MAG: hypothetical protein QXW01_01740 [Candidatus Aenigmatarchaeota archaeon]